MKHKDCWSKVKLNNNNKKQNKTKNGKTKRCV